MSKAGTQGRGRQAAVTAAVLLCRIVTGLTFAISGWAKAIDPWGGIYKIEEYLAVWGMAMPREIVLTGAVALACVEFLLGILLLSGSLKRVAAWGAAAMMAFMLPLTVYIAIADPVADCGCFGDFLVISNTATMLKNIVLAAMAGVLVAYNGRVGGIFPAAIQWLVVVLALSFPLWLASWGYQVQPLVDFRPYKTGTALLPSAAPEGESGAEEESSPEYVYEKDGVRKSFPLSALPDDDSGWEFVEARDTEASAEDDAFAVYDADDNELQLSDVLAAEGPQFVLVISEPDIHFLSRSHYVNELNSYLSDRGVPMVAFVGTTGSGLAGWRELTRPAFEAYSVEDTSLKQLARGAGAAVYLRDGVIIWKSNLVALDPELPETPGPENALDSIKPIDTGAYHLLSLAVFLGLLAVVYLLGQSPRIMRVFLPRKSEKNC